MIVYFSCKIYSGESPIRWNLLSTDCNGISKEEHAFYLLWLLLLLSKLFIAYNKFHADNEEDCYVPDALL